MAKINSRGAQEPNYVHQAQPKNSQVTEATSALANKVKNTALSTITSINQPSFSKKYPQSIAKEVGDVFRKNIGTSSINAARKIRK